MSASHTTAFLRCLEAGITSPDGQPLEVSKKDPAWTLIQEGWSWKVIHHQVEQAIPTLAAFVQLAMNASNSIGKPINEVEVGLQLANHFSKGIPLAEAVAMVKQGDVRCRGSISHIATYVQKYAGGAGFPLLYFLAKFSSQVGGALLLGSQVMATIANLEWKDPTCVYPFIRTACWATMLTSGTSRDGYATVLTKGDVEKLRAPATMAEVAKAESILKDAWAIHDSMKEDSQQENQFFKCFGRLAVRTILYLTHKQKQAREARTWENLPQILQAFTDELPGASQAEGSKSSSTQAMPVSNVLVASPKTLAMLQNLHMEIGQVHLITRPSVQGIISSNVHNR